MLAIVAAALLAAAPPQDTVFTADGGRAVGKVVEEGPQGVAIQLPDGTYRRFARREVLRIEYADGSVSKPAETPAPPQAAPSPQANPPPQAYPPPPPRYAPPPPPAYVPPPYAAPPPRPPPPVWHEPRGGGPASPLYLSFNLGGAFFSGEAERDVNVDRVFGSQFTFGLEGGFRITPQFAVGLYVDGGAGDPGREIRNECNALLVDCTASTGRFGVLFRTTFQPAARATPWVSIGTGYESSTIEVDGGGFNDLTYSGWEILRLQGGFDFRSNRVFGVGVYAGLRVGRYGKVEDFNGTVHLDGARATHTTAEAGVRFTLFP